MKKTGKFGLTAGTVFAILLTAAITLAGCAGRSSLGSGNIRTEDEGSSGNVRTEDGGSRGTADEGSRQEGADRLCVATTIFPYYDFVRQIAGDRVRLKLVVPAGMDSHSFEPTPADVVGIQESDLILYNGGEMEQWMDQVLASIDRPDIPAVRMMDVVDVLEEELVEGMEEEEEHGHSHEEEEYAPGQLHDIEYDEHIWTSPVNAMKIVEIISRTLIEADPENQSFYEGNTRRYLGELEHLDQEFRTVFEEARQDMIVVGDRFPFRYLAETYGFQYRAAFAGCAGDTEPSARTIAYLINQVKERQLKAVYYLELSSHRVAEIIGEETGARPLLLHSCHNVTRRELDEGITYLQLMEQNVRNLQAGLQ